MDEKTTTDSATTTALGAAAAGAGKVTEPVKSEGVADPAKVEADKATAAAAAEKTAVELGMKPFTDLAQLTLADGVKFDEAAMKEFMPLAKEAGLTAKQAQALVDFDAKRAAAYATSAAESKEAASKSAIEALKADKEIGGANFEKSMALAAKALAYIGSEELTKALDTVELADGSKLGDSLVMAKLLASLGKKVSEDTTHASHSSGGTKTAANDRKTLLNEMYGPQSIKGGGGIVGNLKIE